MSQIRSYPEHVNFIFRHKVSISKDKMSPNQTFSMEKMEKLMRNSPFMPLALPQYCDWATSVRQRHLSNSDICPTATSVCQRHLSDSRIRDFGQMSLSDRNRFLRHQSDYICIFGSHSYVRSLRVIL